MTSENSNPDAATLASLIQQLELRQKAREVAARWRIDVNGDDREPDDPRTEGE